MDHSDDKSIPHSCKPLKNKKNPNRFLQISQKKTDSGFKVAAQRYYQTSHLLLSSFISSALCQFEIKNSVFLGTDFADHHDSWMGFST